MTKNNPLVVLWFGRFFYCSEFAGLRGNKLNSNHLLTQERYDI